jgi:hypothetical protein
MKPYLSNRNLQYYYFFDFFNDENVNLQKLAGVGLAPG